MKTSGIPVKQDKPSKNRINKQYYTALVMSSRLAQVIDKMCFSYGSGWAHTGCADGPKLDTDIHLHKNARIMHFIMHSQNSTGKMGNGFLNPRSLTNKKYAKTLFQIYLIYLSRLSPEPLPVFWLHALARSTQSGSPKVLQSAGHRIRITGRISKRFLCMWERESFYYACSGLHGFSHFSAAIFGSTTL